MSEAQSAVQTPDASSISSMMKYIEVLIESFPQGLSQKELAVRANVSPSAVSKIKERLFPFCNIETLAFDSKMVLEPNADLLKMVVKDYLEEKNLLNALKIVSTNYGERVISGVDFHNFIITAVPVYEVIFTPEETKLMTTIFLRFARSVRIPLIVERKIESLVETVKQSGFPELEDVDAISLLLLGARLKQTQFDWLIDSEEELHKLIVLRDKVFYVLKRFGNRFAEEVSIYRSLSKQEKKTYKRVCEKIVDYYLRRVFGDLTVALESTAVKKKLSFDQSYREIGSSVEESFMQEISRIL